MNLITVIVELSYLWEEFYDKKEYAEKEFFTRPVSGGDSLHAYGACALYGIHSEGGSA